MKTKVLAVLLAVCMIAGTCVLFASAETKTFAQNSYVVRKDGKPITASTTYGDLIAAKTPTNFVVSGKASGATASLTATAVDAGNVTSLCDFKPAFDASVLAVSGTIGTTNASVYLEVTNTDTVYKVLNKASGEDADTVDPNNFDLVPCYTINNKSSDTISVNNVKRTEKLYSLTVGLRFYGEQYQNLSAAEIAEVQVKYLTNPIDPASEITVYTNTVHDLREGTQVTVSSKLKDDSLKTDYAFSCWVNANGDVIGDSPEMVWTAGTHASAIYAVYKELKGRVRINYSSNGDGDVAYQEMTSTNKVLKRDVAQGDGQISVMEGRKVTFVFTPKEGYEVAHVYVDKVGSGNKVDIASFKSIPLATGSWLDALKALINATNKDVYEYTFTSADLTGMPNQIRSIEVVFAPIENFEAPSGKELPTIEAEGITLATGANGENGEGGEGGANGGNGGTTVPAENGAAGSGSAAIGGVVNPATGSTGAIAVFAALSVAAAAAFVTAKKKED